MYKRQIETFESTTNSRLDTLETDLSEQRHIDHADITDDLNIFLPENASTFTLVDGVYRPVELEGELVRIEESPVNPDISAWTGSVSAQFNVPIGAASGNNVSESVGDLDPNGNQMYDLGTSNVSEVMDETLTPGLNLIRSTRDYEAVFYAKKNTGVLQFGHGADNPNPQEEQHVVQLDTADGTFTELIANAVSFTLFIGVTVTDLGDTWRVNLPQWMLVGSLSNSRDGRFIYRGLSGSPVVSRPYILGKYKQVVESSSSNQILNQSAISLLDATLITLDTGTTNIVYNNINPGTGVVSVLDGQITRFANRARLNFQVRFDEDDIFTLNIAGAILPTSRILTAKATALSGNGVHEPFSDINFSVSSGTLLFFNRANTIDSDVIWNIEVIVDGYEEFKPLVDVDTFNNQSSSGYYDIGNVRHMFGFDNNGTLTTSVRDISLPAEFADNNYIVTPVAVENGGVNVICTLKTGARETNSFRIEVVLRTGGATDAGVMWHAIGIKP